MGGGEKELPQILNIQTITNSKNPKIQKIQAPKKQLFLATKNAQRIYPSYASLPYPPLLDPDMINYENSDIRMCWSLNIPLPPFYDFVIFGSHAASLHSGVPAMLSLCGCATAGRAGEKESFRIYEQFFEQLKERRKLKDSGECRKIALIISDLALDDENDKLYSLIPANDALCVVRDPISNIKCDNIFIQYSYF